ncbi:MAG: uvrC [Thermoleophilia bacterium]|nr:uvrC [Thermoleophilia bacterium]
MSTVPPEIREHVDRQRKALPNEPGVYLYHGVGGEVLYVGKAKDLRKRVNSYFTKALDARKHAMVLRIADIEVFAVSSEREALQFEANLVKRHQPPFNVMLRDDKSYPYIAVTLGDDYPRVLFSRERKKRPGTRYFGPYTSAKRVRATLDLLNRIFPYRPCEGSHPGRQSGIPCLDYHIKRCAAPCVGYVSQDEYRVIIDDVMAVLGGTVKPVRERLTLQMRQAATDLEFEQAARLRNRIADLEQVMQLQETERPGEGSFDVLGVAVGDELANVQLLQVREGRLHDRRSMFLEQVAGLDAGQVLTQFVLAHYAPGRPVPAQLVVSSDVLSPEQVGMLEEELCRIRDANVEVREAQRGDKRRLAELAGRNAMHAMTYDSLRERTQLERRAMALEQLRDELDLESLPLRIECYDISNLQDESPVASMVVLEDGRPRKDHYRKFAMRHEGGQDDFAMMHEVITRRFARLAAAIEDGASRNAGAELVDLAAEEPAAVEPDGEAAILAPDAIEQGEASEAREVDVREVDPDGRTHDESFSSLPNLVIIDGGKGQLGAAVAALRELGVERVPVVSLAKQEELVFVPGRREPVVLERQSPALHLVQRIRDEAHRFALGYHRNRRSQDARTGRGSVLDTLEGVGDARRRAMLTFFGSPERVLSASLEELEAVPGLPGKVARRIHEQLHRLGGAGVGDGSTAPTTAAPPPEGDEAARGY